MMFEIIDIKWSRIISVLFYAFLELFSTLQDLESQLINLIVEQIKCFYIYSDVELDYTVRAPYPCLR